MAAGGSSLTDRPPSDDVPTRLFPAVQQPLAIAIFVRRADTDPSIPADLHYTESPAGEKPSTLSSPNSASTIHTGGQCGPAGTRRYPGRNSSLGRLPALSDLFPWVTPGITPSRTWVYAPAPAILQDRWTQLVTKQIGSARFSFDDSCVSRRDARVVARMF